jgi:hypothetical protein
MTYAVFWISSFGFGLAQTTSSPGNVSSGPASQSRPAESPARNQRLLEHVRRPRPAQTPARVNVITDRMADVLIRKHLCPTAEYWGSAKASPDQSLPFDEIGTARLIRLIAEYDLYNRIPKPDKASRLKALRYWQSWQDPATGCFNDPRDPHRTVNEKYVLAIIHGLGGQPLYPWTATSTSGKIETRLFLDRTRSDGDWQQGGWGVASQAGFQAIEICKAINAGQTELIPDLEKGLEQILSHQDPGDGLWGPPSAELMNRIGGTLKVVGRLYFTLGMHVLHTRELVDSLVRHSRNSDWYKSGQSSCVPRNVAEVSAYCIEASNYRRTELLEVLDRLAEDYRSWVLPDGTMLMQRGNPGSEGVEYVSIYGLGVIGAYLHWADCRLPNPLADGPRGEGYRYPQRDVRARDRPHRAFHSSPRRRIIERC